MISFFNFLASSWIPLPSLVPLYRAFAAVGIALCENQSTVHALADNQPEQPRSKSASPEPAAFISVHSSEQRRAGLQRVFQFLDENGDGVVSIAEIQQGFKKLDLDISEAQLHTLIKSGSDSERGHLRFDEFNDLYDDICKELALEDASADDDESHDLREAFRVFDKNADGFISVTELQTVLSNLGFAECRDISFCRGIVHRIDANGDGLIDFSEFKQMMLNA